MSLYIRPENFIDDLLHVIDELTAGFVHKGFVAIVNAGLSSGLFVSVFGLYVMYFLYKVRFEGIAYEESVKHLVKALFVFMLASHWDMFYVLIYRLFTEYPERISKMLIDVISGASDDASGASLSNVYARGMHQAGLILYSMGYSPNSVVLCGIGATLVFFSTLFFTVVALGIMIISKIVLSIYLVLAPYYLGLYLFDGTRGLSESWLKHTLGSALVPLFLGVTLAFVLILAELSMVNISGAGASFQAFGVSGLEGGKGPSLSGIIAYFCCSICSLGIIFLSTSMAASLTSSLTQSVVGGSRAASSMVIAGRKKLKERQAGKKGGVKNTGDTQNKSRMKDAVQKRVADRARSAAIKQATMNKRRRMA